MLANSAPLMARRWETNYLTLSVTVVICTRNRPLLLERCLHALQEVDYSRFSTIVVDSAPTSDAAMAIAYRYNADYVISSLGGLSRARNVGTHRAHSDIVAYLDDDMVPCANWLRSLVDEFVDEG